MTEQNQQPHPAPNVEPDQTPHDAPDRDSGSGAARDAAGEAPALAADIDWPALPSHQTQGRQAQVQDPAVSAVLDRLAAVRLTPVFEHGEAYAGMHDALLEALNEDVASDAGIARRIHGAGDGGS
ncbi:hypothetical protein SAMN04487914_1327 [Arthrobacter sp. ok909]|uniref:hypothetical protein n=1 Tax=Arthrobacter sp. ok909 TaxID=1761746 RepID=UPI00088DDC1C|nr:hypothetical protein [Arthrobacter sp. ok909]SDP73672.1 hypothetical protein SAMN04487914_1327 [Arthrobacter sp. ok909]